VVRSLARRLSSAFNGIEVRLRAPADVLALSPGPGSWSPIEVAEHVALANHHLILLVEKIAARAQARARRGERPPLEPSRFDLLERLASREFAWQSPPHMVPSGVATAREIAACLRGQRRRCLALLAGVRDGEGALHTISMSVVGGRLDLYQYLALVALHMERHARQMDRIIPDE
jgi:hypothetical protein